MAGRAKQKLRKMVSIPHTNDDANGYRAYLDISMATKNEKYHVPANQQWWFVLVSTKLQLKVLHFFKMKNTMMEPTCALLHHWSNAGKSFSKLQMDNAGENKKLESRSKSAAWKNPVAIAELRSKICQLKWTFMPWKQSACNHASHELTNGNELSLTFGEILLQ